MARAASEDLFHSFRFWATAVRSGTGDDPLKVNGLEAGFSSITTPEYTLEAVEYREGNSVFTKKFPGLPTTADLTFSRGVVLNDTGFFNWLIETMASGNEYRADVSIYQVHRAGIPQLAQGSQNFLTSWTAQQIPNNYRTYTVFEAFPIRVKPAGDLDASTADVSIAEADVAYEYFKIEDTSA